MKTVIFNCVFIVSQTINLHKKRINLIFFLHNTDRLANKTNSKTDHLGSVIFCDSFESLIFHSFLYPIFVYFHVYGTKKC